MEDEGNEDGGERSFCEFQKEVEGKTGYVLKLDKYTIAQKYPATFSAFYTTFKFQDTSLT